MERIFQSCMSLNSTCWLLLANHIFNATPKSFRANWQNLYQWWKSCMVHLHFPTKAVYLPPPPHSTQFHLTMFIVHAFYINAQIQRSTLTTNLHYHCISTIKYYERTYLQQCRWKATSKDHISLSLLKSWALQEKLLQHSHIKQDKNNNLIGEETSQADSLTSTRIH